MQGRPKYLEPLPRQLQRPRAALSIFIYLMQREQTWPQHPVPPYDQILSQKRAVMTLVSRSALFQQSAASAF